MKIRSEKATTWGDIFNRYRAKGLDLCDAAFRADAWEKRQPKAISKNPPVMQAAH
jgi:hypothetical protein